MTAKTTNRENLQKKNQILNSEERAVLSQIATKEPPYSSRAQALLAIDLGTTQTEAGRQAGLTQGQVRYWLKKFRNSGMSAFPEEPLNQARQDADVDEVQPDLPEAETAQMAEPVYIAPALQEDAPKTKKKEKKKTKKKSKKKTQAKTKKKPKKQVKKKSKKRAKKKTNKQAKKKSKKEKKPAKKTKKKGKK